MTSRVETSLTDREIEILQLYADGLTTKDIGKQLWIAPETVKSHTRWIRVKLECGSTLQAVVIAIRQGVVT